MVDVEVSRLAQGKAGRPGQNLAGPPFLGWD